MILTCPYVIWLFHHQVIKCIQNPCQYKQQLMNHGGILILSVIINITASILSCSSDNQTQNLGSPHAYFWLS